MKTETLSEAALERADEEAVMQHYLQGTPVDPDVQRRVQERAKKIRERIRATHGVLSEAEFQALLGEDDDA